VARWRVRAANAVRPESPRLHRARTPTSAQLTELADTIARRVCRHLAKRGWLEGEEESAFLTDSARRRRRPGRAADEFDHLPHRHRKTRGTESDDAANVARRDAGSNDGDAGKVGGFSLHAGVAAEAHESGKLEKLCRYITRPAISERRLSISPQGKVRYELKTPWRTARRMWSSSRWSSSPNWPRWCRRRART
jgi:hypothetical protein